MFLANSLKEKLSNTDFDDQICSYNKPKFHHKHSKLNSKSLLYFGNLNHSPDNLKSCLSSKNIREMSIKEMENKFTLKKLREKWKMKVPLNFSIGANKFSKDSFNPGVLEKKLYIKKFLDLDILEHNTRKWNNSSSCSEKIRPELKQTLFEVNHGLKDFKVIPP